MHTPSSVSVSETVPSLQMHMLVFFLEPHNSPPKSSQVLRHLTFCDDFPKGHSICSENLLYFRINPFELRKNVQKLKFMI